MCFLKELFELSSFSKEVILVGVELGCTSFEKTLKSGEHEAISGRCCFWNNTSNE